MVRSPAPAVCAGTRVLRGVRTEMEGRYGLQNRRDLDARRMDVQPSGGGPANLADIRERVLGKGIVIAGDLQINLLDIELLTIKLRLLVASVERAQEMGINWWESDPSLSRGAKQLEEENRDLRERLDRLERIAGLPAPREGEEVILEETRREEVVEKDGDVSEEKVVESTHEEVVEAPHVEVVAATKPRKGGGGRGTKSKRSSGG